MKKVLLVFSLIVAVFISHSQTKWWAGAGDGESWSDGLNWFPAGAPGPTDDVLLDNSVLMSSYNVYLPGGNVSVAVNSLTITPGPSNQIILRLPGSNIASPAFTASGPGDAIVLNKGAVFINASGRTSAMGGNTVVVAGTSFLRINNGARYVHKTPAGHTANWAARLSTVAGTENGVFEFDVPAVAPVVYPISSASTRYGNLVISSDSAGASRSYSSNGSTAIIRGDLDLRAGVTYQYMPPAAGANYSVAGNLHIGVGSTFDFSSNANAMNLALNGNLDIQGTITETGSSINSVITLNGSLNQDLSVTGSVNNNISLRINNPEGATLKTELKLPYNLHLTNGKIKTGTINILTMADNAIYSGGSPASFIEGPMKKGGDDDFIYPVGKGNIYAPVNLTGTEGMVGDTFCVEYIRSNPQAIYGTNYETGLPGDNIEHISFVEYWMINRVAGASAKYVTLPVNCESFCKNLGTLFITKYDVVAGQWQNLLYTDRMSGSLCSPYLTGTITAGPVNGFSPFTFATSEPVIDNPLPLRLIHFDAKKMNDHKARISWELADHNKTNIKFEVQRSGNGKDFENFVEIRDSEAKRSYEVYDNLSNKNIVYYRVRMTEADDIITYSSTVKIESGNKGFLTGSIIPDPVCINARLLITCEKAAAINFSIYDMQGRRLKQWPAFVAPGFNNLLIPTDDLKAGVYLLVINNGGLKMIRKFVKI